MEQDAYLHHRPQWKSRLGFVLAAIGSAIGLGNIWRFPYLCYKNGGGAFLIPYFIALFVIGIPLMILEIGLGFKMRGAAPASYCRIDRKWEWLGWWQIIFVMFGIVLYYSVVISWCVNYLFFSFNLGWGADTNDFFFTQFLKMSEGPFALGDVRGGILTGLVIVWFLNWLVVFRGIEKGLERANKIFMPVLFLLIFVIVGWSLCLPYAGKGVEVYLKWDFNRLRDYQVWIDAFSQIFFTLSIGFGIMIAYGSYLPRKSEIVKDSSIISFTNCLFSLIAGFGVFAVLGYMSGKMGVPVDKVVDKSIGLAFVVFPKAIAMLPAFPKLFGFLFFLSLVIAGLSSSVSIVEAFSAGLIDKFQYNRKIVVSVVCLTGFFGSIVFATQGGLFWLDIVDHFLTQYGLVLGSIFECFILGWLYKSCRLRTYINQHAVMKLPAVWDTLIKFVVPIILVIVVGSALIQEISSAYEGYPPIALIMIGRDWLFATLFFAIVTASRPWKKFSSESL